MQYQYKVKWKDVPHIKVKVELVVKEIKEIIETEGNATPKNMVEYARRNRKSSLYASLDWNDKRAAEEHRKAQAAKILRSIVIVIKETEKSSPIEVRAFVNIARKHGRSGYYIAVEDVMSNPMARRELLIRAFNELQAWQQRYDNLTEFAELFKAIKKVRKKIKTFEKRK